MVIHLFPSHFPFRVSYLVKFLSSLPLFTPFPPLCSFFRSFDFLHYFLCFSWVSAFFSPFLSVFHALISIMLLFSIFVLFPFYPLFASFPFYISFPPFFTFEPIPSLSSLLSLFSRFPPSVILSSFLSYILSKIYLIRIVHLPYFWDVLQASGMFLSWGHILYVTIPFFSDMTSASPTSRLVVVNVIVVVSVIGKF